MESSRKENLTKEERKALKQKTKFLKEQEQFAISGGTFPTNDNKLNVLCVRFGNKYPIDYVFRLRNMIERHLSVPHRIYCLTDDPTPISGVELIGQSNAGYTKGWWHKVHMFDPRLPISGRILYMDLDVIICRNIDKLSTVWNNDFIGIRDFNRKFHPQWKHLNSSVMSWNHGTQSHIYQQFQENPRLAMRFHGDQDWIWKTSKDRLKFWPDNWIQSYKWEIRNREELIMLHGQRQFKTVRDDVYPHQDCCIAVFHGDPNPAQVQDKFVKENWL